MPLRSAIFTLGYFISGAIYGTLSIFTWVLPPMIRHRFIIGWTSFGVAWLRFTCNVDHQLYGEENLKKVDGPIIVMSKHQSTWETLYLQHLFFPAITVLKRELVNIPFFGWGLRALRPIAINRSKPREALRKVKTIGSLRLSEGYNLLLFPEGTRSAPGEKQKYARSGADIAVKTKLPVLPVALNSGLFWPRGNYGKTSGTIQVFIGEPIYPEDKTSKELIKEVEDWIESKVSEII